MHYRGNQGDTQAGAKVPACDMITGPGIAPKSAPHPLEKQGQERLQKAEQRIQILLQKDQDSELVDYQ